MAKEPSANPSYKLTYFNVKALAEPIRILFAYGGIAYEDVRIEKENWPAIKNTMPMGQMPILDVDGIRLHQSIAIARYVAKKVGLAGANDWESLLIDIAVDTVNDFRAKIGAVHYEADEAVKQKKFEDLKKDVIPFYLSKLDAIAKENNGYLALGKLTWADIFLLGISDYVNFMLGTDLAENHPNLKQVINNAASVPSIKVWLENRPKTEL